MKPPFGLHPLLSAFPLVFAGIVHADMVVVAGKNAGEMTKEQVADVFLGKSTILPGGGGATPIDQPESSPLREEFYGKVTGKTAAQVKSLWSKLAFTGKGTQPKEAAGGSPEVKKLVVSMPGAIGYIEKAAVDDSVKVVFHVQ